MGCCQSEESNENNEADVNERSRLLQDPVRDGPANVPSYSGQSPVNTFQPKSTENTAYSRILHVTADNVIDVSALDPHPLEQQEFSERSKHFKLKLTTSGVMLKGRVGLRLPSGVAAPLAILSAPPLPATNLDLVSKAAEHANKALAHVKVKHKEDLVVSFGL